MPSRLTKFNTDPQKKGRGAGLYYHRGKGIYSKYDPDRDSLIVAKGYKVDKIGFPVKSKGRHLSDGKLKNWGTLGKKKKK